MYALKCEKPVFGGDFKDIYINNKEFLTKYPLLQEIYNATNIIHKIFIYKEIIAIHKTPNTNWDNVKDVVYELVSNYEFAELIEENATDNNIINQIQSIIDQFIQPYVAMHGGYVKLDKFENGIAYILMGGSCDGCPSVSETLQGGIEHILKFKIKEIIEVRLADNNTT